MGTCAGPEIFIGLKGLSVRQYHFRQVLLYILFFTNKGQIGCCDIIVHYHLYLVKKKF